ncbi:MAG: tetratricopeptide repeat protein [Armatimonadota bacterium]
MKRSSRIILLLIVVALIPVIVQLQKNIDPLRAQFQPGKGISAVMTNVGNNPVVLPSQFVAGTLIGFREVVAGLLWVRTDEFFHNGNFEAIVPLIRIITWLDPHQVDIYSTGAWHLSYNFTDSAERADRRYLPPALKFMEEGIENNPNVWDLKFGLGFMLHCLKTLNFKEAIYWEKEAAKDKDCKLFVHRQIAHAYEKSGNIDMAVKQWQTCLSMVDELRAKYPKDNDVRIHHDVSKKNLDSMLVRKAVRANLSQNPFDVQFEVKIRKLSPKVLMVVGKTNLPDGARIDFTLADTDFKDYDQKKLDVFSWQVNPEETALYETGMHGILVTKGKFQSKYNMSKDPRQYSFAKQKYIVTFTFNPRTAGAKVQDVVGWNGEGIGKCKYLDTSLSGVRRIRKVMYLDKSDII